MNRRGARSVRQEVADTEQSTVLRWVQFAAAAAVLVAGAVWLVVPASGEKTEVTTPTTNAALPDGGHDHGNLPRGYVGPPISPPIQVNSPEPSPTGPAPARQYLAAMYTFAGANNIRAVPNGAKPSQTFTMACAADRGPDLFREVRYHLRGNYTVLTAQLRNRGSADWIRVHVLGADGTLYDQKVASDATANVRLDLGKSEYLRIRLFCASPESTAEFADALVIR